MPKLNRQSLLRIVDANVNRLKEGLRVCEDICRFIWNDPQATRKLKAVRHEITAALSELDIKELIAARDIAADVGKASRKSELTRRDVKDIFLANAQRSKESLRVLEEFSKLLNGSCARKFKAARYKLYDVEKKITARL